MNSYHVMFREKQEDETARGKNYEAEDEVKALIAWKAEYPNAIFIYHASSEMFTHKYCLSLSPPSDVRNEAVGE